MLYEAALAGRQAGRHVLTASDGVIVVWPQPLTAQLPPPCVALPPLLVHRLTSPSPHPPLHLLPVCVYICTGVCVLCWVTVCSLHPPSTLLCVCPAAGTALSLPGASGHSR